MASPSVTNTFANGTTADAGDVNTNFSDLVNALTDGSKDLTINAVTANGTVTMVGAATVGTTLEVTGATTLNGAVTLGDAAADAITFTGTAEFTETITCAAINSTGKIDTTGEVECDTVDASGTIDTDGACQASYFLPDGDDTSAPGANRLYKANVPKAWAFLTCGVGGSVTVTDDHNIASASYVNTDMTVSIDTDMANTTYAVLITNVEAAADFIAREAAVARAVGSFTIDHANEALASSNWANTDKCYVLVMGDQ